MWWVKFSTEAYFNEFVVFHHDFLEAKKGSMKMTKKINIGILVFIVILTLGAFFELYKAVSSTHPDINNFYFFVLISAIYTTLDVLMFGNTTEYKNLPNEVDKCSMMFSKIVQDLFNPVFLLLASFYLSAFLQYHK